MQNRLTDLRFVIGLFFILTGILLLMAAFTVKNNHNWEENVNLYTGICVLIFGIGMFLAAIRKKQVD